MPPLAFVIDDNVVNQELMEWALEGLADVKIFGDGESACRSMREHQPAAIFLDLMMPGLSGLEVLERMKTDCPELVGRVIVVSASDDTKARSQAVAFGIAGFQPKPLSIDAIASAFKAIAA